MERFRTFPLSLRFRSKITEICRKCGNLPVIFVECEAKRYTPDVEEIRVGNSIPDIVISVQAYVTSAVHGINSSLLNLPGLTGLYILSQLKYKCAISPTAKEYPICHMDVEVSNSQRKILQVTHRSALTKHEIVKDVYGNRNCRGVF